MRPPTLCRASLPLHCECAVGRPLTPYEMRQALTTSVDKLPLVEDRDRIGGYYGGGRLNVLRALLAVEPE